MPIPRLSLAALALTLGAGVPAALAQPSFDCRYARYADEELICSRANLAELDVELAELYALALRQAPRAQRGAIEADEALWLESRHGCGADAQCIRQHYRERIAELRFIVGLAEPPRDEVADRGRGDDLDDFDRDDRRADRGRDRDGDRDFDRGRDWVWLGATRVGRERDRDVIRLGREEGRFDAIRLEAMENDVRLRRVEVVYGNGVTDEIEVRRRLREGERSEVLELRGRRGRAIDRIVLVYDTQGRGPAARLEVWGREG